MSQTFDIFKCRHEYLGEEKERKDKIKGAKGDKGVLAEDSQQG